jgi:hypothetical protein
MAAISSKRVIAPDECNQLIVMQKEFSATVKSHAASFWQLRDDWRARINRFRATTRKYLHRRANLRMKAFRHTNQQWCS